MRRSQEGKRTVSFRDAKMEMLLSLSTRRVCEMWNTGVKARANRNQEDIHFSSSWDEGGGRRAKNFSRITQTASHQAKEIIGGNEVSTYKARRVSLYSEKGKKKRNVTKLRWLTLLRSYASKRAGVRATKSVTMLQYMHARTYTYAGCICDSLHLCAPPLSIRQVVFGCCSYRSITAKEVARRERCVTLGKALAIPTRCSSWVISRDPEVRKRWNTSIWLIRHILHLKNEIYGYISSFILQWTINLLNLNTYFFEY